MAGIGSVSVDTYLAGLPSIAIAMDAPIERVQLSIGAFFMGIALAPLVYGPLSDRYGRIVILCSGMFVFMLAVVGCATSSRIETFLAFRGLQGMGAGAASVLARATVRDLYGPLESARVLSLIQALTGVLPILGPMGGSYLLLMGWRSAFWLMGGYGLLCLLAFVLLIKETRPNQGARTHTNALKSYWQVLSDRSDVGYILSGGACFAGLFAFVGGSSFVFIELYEFTPQRYGVLFSLASTGLIIGGYLGAYLIPRFGIRRMQIFESAICAATGSAVFVIVRFGDANAFIILGLAWFYLAAMNAMAANSMAGMLARHAERAGAASALGGLAMFSCGALGVLLVSTLHDGTAIPLSASMMVGGAAGFLVQWSLIRE